ncbi:MAG: tetratricopeptide repeat protein [Phycisphaerales bacterium]|nr:tetratricopeptide repeat protein [Phycisphaerales bacterium]
MPWWWHLLIFTATLLFFIGQRGKSKALRLESVGTRMKQAREALDSALAAGDRSLEAKAHFDVGIAFQDSYSAPRRGEPPDYGPLRTALEHLCRARDVYAELRNTDGQGLALSNLGVIYSVMHRDDEAVAHLRSALSIAKTLNHPGWERSTLNRLTRLLGEMGKGPEAIELIKDHTFGRASRT